MTEAEERSPFIVHCGDCKHEWAAAYFPMEAMAFAKVAMQNGKLCPRCGSKKVYCGHAGQGGAVSATIEERPRKEQERSAASIADAENSREG